MAFYNSGFSGVAKFAPMDSQMQWHCQFCNKVLAGTGEICSTCANQICENCGGKFIDHLNLLSQNQCENKQGESSQNPAGNTPGLSGGTDSEPKPKANPNRRGPMAESRLGSLAGDDMGSDNLNSDLPWPSTREGAHHIAKVTADALNLPPHQDIARLEAKRLEEGEYRNMSKEEYFKEQRRYWSHYTSKMRCDLEDSPNNRIDYSADGSSYEKLLQDGTMYSYEKQDFGGGSSAVSEQWHYPGGPSVSSHSLIEQDGMIDGAEGTTHRFHQETIEVRHDESTFTVYSNSESASSGGRRSSDPRVHTETLKINSNQYRQFEEDFKKQHQFGPWSREN